MITSSAVSGSAANTKRQLQTVANSIDAAETRTRQIEKKLKNVEALPDADERNCLVKRIARCGDTRDIPAFTRMPTIDEACRFAETASGGRCARSGAGLSPGPPRWPRRTPTAGFPRHGVPRQERFDEAVEAIARPCSISRTFPCVEQPGQYAQAARQAVWNRKRVTVRRCV